MPVAMIHRTLTAAGRTSSATAATAFGIRRAAQCNFFTPPPVHQIDHALSINCCIAATVVPWFPRNLLQIKHKKTCGKVSQVHYVFMDNACPFKLR